MSNTRTVLLTPEIYVNQNVYEQLVDLMLETLRGARKCGQVCHCLSASRLPWSIIELGEALAPLAAERGGRIWVSLAVGAL